MDSSIFNIAKSLFYEKGYSKTKISDITNKLGLVPANFYRHYSSKEELLKEVIATETKEYIEAIKGFQTKDTFQDKVKLIFQINLTFLFEKPQLFALLEEIKTSKYKLGKSTLNLVSSIDSITKHSINSILEYSTIDTFKKRVISDILINDLNIFLENLIKDSNGRICSTRVFTLNMTEEFERLFNLIKGICYGLGISSDLFSKIDPTTGIYKEDYFLELLAKSYSCLTCQNTSIDVLYITLVGFNKEKDQFFHKNLFQSIGTWLRSSFRESDKAGIIGENSFALLLSKHSSSIHSLLMERSLQFEKLLKEKYPTLSILKLDTKVLSIKEGHSINFSSFFSSKELIEQNTSISQKHYKN